MKTPSPQIVSAHSLVSYGDVFPSCWTVTKTAASWPSGAHSGSSRAGRPGKEMTKTARLHHQVRRNAKEREQKMCLGCLENPQPLGHHGPISRFSSSHPSSHISRPLYTLNQTLLPQSSQSAPPPLFYSLSTLPARQRLSASKLVLRTSSDRDYRSHIVRRDTLRRYVPLPLAIRLLRPTNTMEL